MPIRMTKDEEEDDQSNPKGKKAMWAVGIFGLACAVGGAVLYSLIPCSPKSNQRNVSYKRPMIAKPTHGSLSTYKSRNKPKRTPAKKHIPSKRLK